MLDLRLAEITDPILRENFRRIQEGLTELAFLKGKWRFVEIEFKGALADQPFAHGLGFAPKDVLVTSVLGSGSVTWSYSKFTREHVYLSSTGPVTVRAFIGSYYEKGNK